MTNKNEGLMFWNRKKNFVDHDEALRKYCESMGSLSEECKDALYSLRAHVIEFQEREGRSPHKSELNQGILDRYLHCCYDLLKLQLIHNEVAIGINHNVNTLVEEIFNELDWPLEEFLNMAKERVNKSVRVVEDSE
jgi:hypothetical protein